MKRFLRIALATLVLIVVALYFAFSPPMHSQASLNAIALESQRMMTDYPLGPSGQAIDIPKDKWPPAIRKLKPYRVVVRQGMIDIGTKEYFDGGWGYGFAPDRHDLTMLQRCWAELGHGLYWHGPC